MKRKDQTKMTTNWNNVLANEFNKPYYQKLYQNVKNEYEHNICHPDWNDIFQAFDLTDLKDVKVVIIGQDPYHGKNQAHGLCFSVNKGVKVPPSLINIYKELKNEFPNYVIPITGDLTEWAKQGVLLLNSTLTVRDGVANSHEKYGWSTFTDEVIKILNKEDRPIVYLLWGNYAKSKATLINNPKQLILTSSHPSPMSVNYGFFGNNHFISCNNFLKQNGIEPIDWQIH